MMDRDAEQASISLAVRRSVSAKMSLTQYIMPTSDKFKEFTAIVCRPDHLLTISTIALIR
jgi:hypothetical protein